MSSNDCNTNKNSFNHNNSRLERFAQLSEKLAQITVFDILKIKNKRFLKQTLL